VGIALLLGVETDEEIVGWRLHVHPATRFLGEVEHGTLE
jgi:hypothetical protein